MTNSRIPVPSTRQTRFTGRLTGRLTVCAALAGVLAACGSSSSSTSNFVVPDAPPADATVAALLPSGPFDVEGELTLDGKVFSTVSGYVDFGVDQDGTGCATDHVITGMNDNAAGSSVRALRAPGGPSWFRGEGDSAAATVWFDRANPDAPGVPLLFLPPLVAGGAYGELFPGDGFDNLCSITVLPRLMTVDGDMLVFDQARVEAAMASGNARWTMEVLTAAGVTGSEFDRRARTLAGLFSADPATGLIDGVTLRFEDKQADGSFSLVQYDDGKATVSLRFTPTAKRVIEAPDAETYFEQVAADPTVLTAVIPEG